MPRVLITGATGQIGSALCATAPADFELHQVARNCVAEQPFLHAIDLSGPAEVQQLLRGVQPQIIINAAAWTDVDGAQRQVAAAHALNAELPGWLAAYAESRQVLLLHYSTDYVFAGDQPRAYQETDHTDPGSTYGHGKLAGEQAILERTAAALILRTSWVYGGPTRNFVASIAEKLIAGETLKVVDDQYGCPTWSRDVATCSWAAIQQLWPVQDGLNTGLYHLAGADQGSWYDFACRIEQELGQLDMLPYDPNLASRVAPCGTAEYPRPAPRPMYSMLNSNRFYQHFNCRPAGWPALRQCLRSLYATPPDQQRC